MAFISLQQRAYERNIDSVNISNNSSHKNIAALVDDIVIEMVENNSKLINDVEVGLIPESVLAQAITDYLGANKITLAGNSDREELIKQVKSYIWGYGPLQDLINDPNVSDIKVVNENSVRKKIKGERHSTDIKFASVKSLETFCRYICIKNGGSLSEINAIQVLSDTKSNPDFLFRIIICIPPVNRSPSIAIRKISKNKRTLEDLVNEDMFNIDIYIYLLQAIKSKLNIIWSGKGASGKTTCMNACVEVIPENESVLVMQESEEIYSSLHPDMLFEKEKKKAGEDDKEYTLNDFTITGLLQDIDRMIISETKGKEAMELFNAIYTGCVGWTSLHASSSEQTLLKAVHLAKYSNTDLKQEQLLEMLSEVDLIVFMRDFKCVELTEIAGFDYNTKQIIYNPIFKYHIKKSKNGKIEGYWERLNQSCHKVQNKFNITDFNLKEMIKD